MRASLDAGRGNRLHLLLTGAEHTQRWQRRLTPNSEGGMQHGLRPPGFQCPFIGLQTSQRWSPCGLSQTSFPDHPLNVQVTCANVVGLSELGERRSHGRPCQGPRIWDLVWEWAQVLTERELWLAFLVSTVTVSARSVLTTTQSSLQTGGGRTMVSLCEALSLSTRSRPCPGSGEMGQEVAL